MERVVNKISLKDNNDICHTKISRMGKVMDRGNFPLLVELYFKNKFVLMARLFRFIISIFEVSRSPERQI